MNISNTNHIMQQVLLGLSVGIITLFYFFGWGIVWQILLAIIGALSSEALILWLRKKPILLSLFDGSALITATLLAIAIPSIAPWWLVILGSSFAIIFGKQLYGGLGNNPFNPAMLGYVFLLIAYPLEMSSWQSVDFITFGQSVEIVFFNTPVDVLTAPTPLDRSYVLTSANNSMVWVWINLSFLLGGLYLLIRKVIDWYIPISMLLGLFLMASLLQTINEVDHANGLFHLFSGATMLAAFFIATDPVSASTTRYGRLIYGFGIGVLIVVIRELSGNYPDGIAFAVLLMNILTPLIDAYTQPKILGK